MLGELFGDGEEDGDFGFQESNTAAAVQANVQTFQHKSRPAHCASNMDKPSDPR